MGTKSVALGQRLWVESGIASVEFGGSLIVLDSACKSYRKHYIPISFMNDFLLQAKEDLEQFTDHHRSLTSWAGSIT